jgi:tetratricopeptide (TPR) repeat protein
VLEAARESADTALSIDPTLGEAIAAKACVSGILDWDWATAEAGFKHALELAPSYPTARQWYATNILAPQRRFADAQEMLQRASELDPGSSAISVSRGIIAFYARDLETATEEFAEVAKLHPRFALVHYFFGQLYGVTEEYTRSVESLERAVDLSDGTSETLGALGHAMARAGRVPEAEAILARLEERSGKRYVSPALPAHVLIGLGRTEAALDRLEAAAQIRATDLIWIGVRPVYDPLAASPRFQAIVDELGLTLATSSI